MKKAIPYLLVAAVFLLLVNRSLLTRGMFSDGLVYASIAANLAEGTCTPLHLSYTPLMIPEFYGHPPLMMLLQSLFFRLFGVSMAVAKVYCAVVALLSAWLIVRVWRRMGYGCESGWLPLMLWTLVPLVTHSANSNLLEATMLLFVLAAVCMMLRERREFLWHALAGVMLALAFLTKGPTGLFPLVLPLLLWAFGLKKHGFGRMALLTLVTTVCVAVPLLVVCLNGDAAEYMRQYLTVQVIGESGAKIVSRWYIVGRFFQQTVVVWIVVAAVLFIGHRRVAVLPLLKEKRMAWVMLALTFCGVLPMMVSTKQREFYILCTMPFFALSMAVLVEPYISAYCIWVRSRAAGIVTVVLMVGAVAFNLYRAGTPGRDDVMLNDMTVIMPELERGEWLGIPRNLYYEYSLPGYYYFEKRVVLDPSRRHHHLLTTAEYPVDSTYRELPLPTEQYHLYELQAE